ncbi:MAG: Asp23/Gls24 family envelope stress response protein [Paeniclostridium sordellii]|uniref:Asp23/Gls24 family envelope stress response protein n=1 Tax=Paeniclostridium hominis TaxID=2764329 RepID=A0ABR7K4D4_9FIRM|nr:MULTISPECIES: Asp23/Gls24 family envelope stress response protein [Paeniclostridium]MBC6003958.1 Asp23/Gls24 family envelope stress response protein [Paeniclostridium hominis]MBC8631047.1 Asp23/Gls24 family envelope stress response protein [[Eubacterium] tenue]MDU2591531.1 Asp23/Gls24 family envelope stress response protein [Paeniclostridium sordellii]
MSAKINNEFGTIEIDKQVIAQIAYKAAMESYGLVGLAHKSKGIVELLKGENATKGVSVQELEDETIAIELYVIMQYGTNISTVANNIIDKVKYTLEKMTAIKVSRIDVNVQGIRVK